MKQNNTLSKLVIEELRLLALIGICKKKKKSITINCEMMKNHSLNKNFSISNYFKHFTIILSSTIKQWEKSA